MSDKSDNEQARQKAAQDLEDIETLKSMPAFKRYFARRVTDELKSLADKILYDATDRRAAWIAILRFRAVFEVSKVLLQDEASCKAVLGQPEATGNT